ncbi:MAG: DUF362 domain-containing protein [Oscillospiraceae bacterium]|nr:DUF362 domain-containing protein [Oscillospiraceae bacterium]
MSVISVVKTENYNPDVLKAAVDRHFSVLKPDSLISANKKIVLKPNLLMKRSPELGTTTHPALLEAVILKLKELGATDITIADSPGGLYSKGVLKSVYSGCGMTEPAEKHGAKLNYGTGHVEVKCPSDNIPNPQEILVKKFTVIDPLANADIIINLPKLKTHSMTGISAAVKNMFGAIPGLMKPEMHWRFKSGHSFADMLIDLCLTVPPTFTIIDAVTAMEGNGPSSGDLREVGYTYAGNNVFALDAVMCKITGLDAGRIATVRRSVERGLTSRNIDDFEFAGDSLEIFGDFQKPETYSVDFTDAAPVPSFMMKWLSKVLAPKPVVIKKMCIGCKKCAESCPAKTIYMSKQKIADINYAKCIYCFCCHEMCPVQAIKIKRRKIFNR